MKWDAHSEMIFNLVRHHLGNAPESEVIKVTRKVQKGQSPDKALQEAGFDPSALSGSKVEEIKGEPDKTGFLKPR